MTILLVGGGTGGHITPLLAVAHELKRADKNVRIVAVTDKSNKFKHILENDNSIDRVVSISAGKLRRYPNQSLLDQLLDVQTIALNIRDAFRTAAGCVQAYRALRRIRPDVVFIKGGFVGVPVGLAAHLQHIPFITHDSDAEPGLANRIIGRWAQLHAVGMPAELYSYPQSKMRYTGIPVAEFFKPVTLGQQKAYRKALHIPDSARMVFVTGGSQGSQRLNEVIAANVKKLTKSGRTMIVHQTGSYPQKIIAESDTYQPHEYITNMYTYTGAADVVIARAGSSVAELAAQHKAVIAVPAPHLAGGHQLKNAQYLQEHDAALVISDDELAKDPSRLGEMVEDLLQHPTKRTRLADNLSQCYPSDAAKQIASILHGYVGA